MKTFQMNVRGHEVAYNGITKPGQDMQFIFFETTSREVAKFLSAWREASYSLVDGTQEAKLDLEATITIYLLDQKDQPQYKYKLIGCLLNDFIPGELGNDDGFLKTTMKVHFDTFEEGTV